MASKARIAVRAVKGVSVAYAAHLFYDALSKSERWKYAPEEGRRHDHLVAKYESRFSSYQEPVDVIFKDFRAFGADVGTFMVFQNLESSPEKCRAILRLATQASEDQLKAMGLNPFSVFQDIPTK